MGDLSASVRLKFDRANEHADAMRSTISRWEQPKPYRFVTEIDEKGSTLSLVRFRYLIRVDRPLPTDHLSKALGDCIHNFRCVLDHLIWELSVAHSGPTPTRPGAIGFPINPSGKTPRGLHAVAASVVTEVKALHASIGPKDPRLAPPLWMLCELSNVDKHRAIHAIQHTTHSVDVTVQPTIVGTDIKILDPPVREPDAIILALVDIPRPVWRDEDVDVHGRTEHCVAIAETAKTPVAHLGLTVEGIKEAVEEAAKRLRHHLP